MRTTFETSASLNGLVVVESLREEERKTGSYLVENLQAELLKDEFSLLQASAVDLAHFRRLMTTLAGEGQQGFRPILHLEAHGRSDGEGLLFAPSGEFLPWQEFADLCRTVNEATRNNLVVVLAACRGYEAITAVDIARTAPFCFLLGPRSEVQNTDLVATTSGFYRALLAQGDLAQALGHLPPSFALFHCERLFVDAFAKYLRAQVIGRGGRANLERLVTKARALYPEAEVGPLRKMLKRRLHDDAHFEKFRRRFLMSDAPGNEGRFNVTPREVLSLARRLRWPADSTQSDAT